MFDKTFWKASLERAVKTAAQSVLVAIGGSQHVLDAWTLDPVNLAGFAVGGFVLSMLTSLGSEPFGPSGDPSLVTTTRQDEGGDDAG